MKLVAFALAALGVAAMAEGGNPWMGRMASVLEDKTLSEVVLPGTHDSGTSGVGTELLDNSGPAVAKTQTATIREQLSDGIRYFDLRVRERAHWGCADPTVFTFYHGQTFGEVGAYHDSYDVVDGLDAVRDFYKDPANAKEVVVLDFQHIELRYNDGRATGVLLKTVQDMLGPHLLPWADVVGTRAATLGELWDAQPNRTVVVLVEKDRLNDGQGCGPAYNKTWFGNRADYIMSYYGEREYSAGIKGDVDAQLSLAMAKAQDRESVFKQYRAMQEANKLRVLQLVPRPSDAWFAAVFLSTRNAFPPRAGEPQDYLLNYADFINHSFNDCPGDKSGWFGQRLWTGLTLGGTAAWNRPNIVIVDNYLAATMPTRFNLQDPPPSPVNWRAMAWDAAAGGGSGDWVQTNPDGTGYVEYVTSLNRLVPNATDPGIAYWSSNNNCYKY